MIPQCFYRVYKRKHLWWNCELNGVTNNGTAYQTTKHGFTTKWQANRWGKKERRDRLQQIF